MLIIIRQIVSFLLFIACAQFSIAHELTATARYLANEGIIVQSGKHKILFDPFFHNNYQIYTLVPEKIKQAVMNNQPPYDNVSAIFISHAHEDHFDAKAVSVYLKKYSHVKLFAPSQAVSMLQKTANYQAIKTQITSVDLAFGDAPTNYVADELNVHALRIPHAGWPGRANVQNLLFFVALDKGVRIVHMGDADPDKQHYRPFQTFFDSIPTDTAFPPYWFGLSEEGLEIVQQIIKAQQIIGIHVPQLVPAQLHAGPIDYFSVPGESRKLLFKRSANSTDTQSTETQSTETHAPISVDTDKSANQSK
ncbi:MBL fold metallo-hydrolase [Aliikangiella maris]|uniref:MBL fold metallo-hydrolase n=2 Tax=Aliikangiella maris TaxID=3162458 RepID=A0ABV3MUP0_9GAMM